MSIFFDKKSLRRFCVGHTEVKMLKFKKVVGILSAFFGRAGVFFTATVFAFNIFASGYGRSFSPDFFGVALLFAALLALCGFVLKIKFISSEILKGVIHVFLATAAFVVSIIFASGIKTTGGAAFVMAVIFAVCDTVALVIRGLYLAGVKKAMSREFTCGDTKEE